MLGSNYKDVAAHLERQDLDTYQLAELPFEQVPINRGESMAWYDNPDTRMLHSRLSNTDGQRAKPQQCSLAEYALDFTPSRDSISAREA